MSNFIVAIIIAVGATAWVYGKFMRSSGNNSKNSVIAAGLTGLIVFVATFLAVGIITSYFNGN